MRALIIALIMLAASPALARDRNCYRDAYGNTICRDSNGVRTHCYTDAYGNTTCRGSDGSVTHCYTDKFGNTTCRGN